MDLSYDIQGDGSPIVMVHSPGVDSREWQEIVPILAKSRKVITFDCRGCGHSPAPQSPTSLVEDLYNLLKHLGLERVTLVGHSMGGQAVTDFTLAYPSMVERLVVICPALTGFQFSNEFTDWMASVNAAAPDIPKLVDLSLAGLNYRVTMTSKYRDFVREMATQYMTRVFTEWKSFKVIWPDPPAIERLEEIKPDTLFIYGTVEWPDMLKIAEEFKRIPSVQFVEIEGGDHYLTLTHAAEVSRHIQTFIQGE
ncbi:alpha/beta fold hydrolase [Aureibacillus halotolerans]|uniref:Pimeloyl-ACP methyl ester carboxylesterase n=1 Tax=Aureibacillus halotolerans TaxID=1508390 RepID=A0A4R6U301_9BACI|nr:alpha/beta hydrolase [Aureibacillus halotolerans]TDQ40381.1 pimeloyl-ACP methyl ester carboxylesterase [Aureibacillus halotolerans]